MDPMPKTRDDRDSTHKSPSSALPSVGVRIFAFVCILVAGTTGALIGYGFTDLQCRGDCTIQTGIGAFVGGVVAAVGTAVVVVLTLRAMGEWKTIRAATGERTDDPGPPEQMPRVR